MLTHVQGQVAYSPDGRHLATLASDCRLWDAHSLQPLHRLDLRPAAQTEGTLVFSGDGHVHAAAEHRRVKLFDVATGAELATLTSPASQRNAALSLSADGSAVAAATQAQTVLFWNLWQLRNELAEMGLDWK